MRTLGRALYRNLRSCIRLPQGYYIAALGLAILLFFLFRKEKMGKRLAISILFPYLFLVLGSTVLKRRTYLRYMHYFRPFYSWRVIIRNGLRRSSYQLAQVLLNMLVEEYFQNGCHPNEPVRALLYLLLLNISRWTQEPLELSPGGSIAIENTDDPLTLQLVQ